MAAGMTRGERTARGNKAVVCRIGQHRLTGTDYIGQSK
ncbi:hypothetical protein AWB83_06090 [Caballeronia ptereochthonis]|uniref:Uncharacterized protein n=1 Tax=Caballeronia ptereochthonis TaxID=1777144 RepID=A0A158DY48_9BURK|nr:hypothetical protein AWB83_06090 [Caballeronia ptereochthonis]